MKTLVLLVLVMLADLVMIPPAYADTASIQPVKIREVINGFAFKDVLGRTFKLIALKKYELDTPSEQIDYDSNMKSVLSQWLATPGETVYVMHDGKRGSDRMIPALVFVGDDFNVSMNYQWRQLAQIDTNVPEWFDLEVFTTDGANIPSYLAEELGIEPAAAEEPLAILIYKGRELVYSGFVYQPEE